jgi:hypothetical protein
VVHFLQGDSGLEAASTAVSFALNPMGAAFFAAAFEFVVVEIVAETASVAVESIEPSFVLD